jgi:hypothetical protein
MHVMMRVLLALSLIGSAACEREFLGAGQSGCQNGSDCESGLRCVRKVCTAIRTGIGGQEVDCRFTDDPFEPNDSADAAREVKLGSFSALRLCPDDEDWFSFEIAEAGPLTVQLKVAQGDAPRGITLHAAGGEELTPSGSESLGGDEVREFDIAGAGTYVLGVTAGGAATPSTYDLSAGLPGPVACLLAPDSSRDAPVALTDGAGRGTLCEGSEGWWSLDLGPGDAVIAEVTAGEAAPGLAIFGAGDEALAEGPSPLELPRVLEAGPHLVRVGGVDAEAAYELTVTVCDNDEGEPGNEGSEGAVATAVGDSSAGVACFADVDWWRVDDLPSAGTVTALLQSEGADDGALDLAIFLDPAGEAATEASLAGGEATADAPMPFGEPVSAWVRVTAGDASVGDYRLTVTAPAPVCENDEHEGQGGNDRKGAQTELGGLRGIQNPEVVSGTLCPGDVDWYGFDAAHPLAPGDGVRLQAEFSAPAEGVVVRVEGGQQSGEWRTDENDPDSIDQGYVFDRGGGLFVQVEGIGNAPLDYELTVTRGPDCTESEDEHEGEQRFEDDGDNPWSPASGAERLEQIDAYSCMADPDSFRLWGESYGQLLVELEWDATEAELTLDLFFESQLVEPGEDLTDGPRGLARATMGDLRQQIRDGGDEGAVVVGEGIARVRMRRGEGAPYTLRVTRQAPATLSQIQDTVFTPKCAIDTCHTASSARDAGGLNLEAGVSMLALVRQPAATAPDGEVDPPNLVEPSDPFSSYLAFVLWDHETRALKPHPPEGDDEPKASTLDLDRIWAWIELGALDDAQDPEPDN